MDKKNIIIQGTKAKYLLEIKAKEFDVTTMDFALTLSWGYRNHKKQIAKADMIEASGGYLFEIDTTEIVGKVEARCTLVWPDTDVSGAERPDVDVRWLCVVVPDPCPNYMCCPKCEPDDEVVKYTRMDESDVGEKYERLVDCYDRPLLTSDGEYIYALRTAEN